MIVHGHYPVEPWAIRENGLDDKRLAQTESVFALSNGHIGVRGNLDEGDPHGIPGTYLNSVFEVRPLPYAEPGYGNPETGQTILNVTNGKLIRLLIDDEPFDVRYGELVSHDRVLDLRGGMLVRDVEWRTPAGTHVRLHTERMVSLSQRSIVAIRYRVEAVDAAVRVVLLSELVTNEEAPAQSHDPRVAKAFEHPFVAVEQDNESGHPTLIHKTMQSGLHVAAAMDHHVECPVQVFEELTIEPDFARQAYAAHLEPGDTIELTKFLAYGWSSQRSVPALRDQVHAALVSAGRTGWDELASQQRAVLDEFWAGADVQLDGAAELQQAVRFGMFHAFQAGARAEERAIAAKGLTGTGYDGHAFWDTETFVLPLLTATAPNAARDALRWRYSTLELARERAKALNLRGAAFPWRTIRGQECSAYWPAGTAALHVNADIAMAAVRYVHWTADTDFDREVALPLLVETARLWDSVGYDGDDGKFHIDGVTGPDEYTAIVDDNAYTNLMASQNLAAAADAARRWADAAAALDVRDAEIDRWRARADRIALHYDDVRQVHEQDRGFTDRQVWDFEHTAETGGYPLLLSAPYFALYRQQVLKQADLVLAMHWVGSAFTAAEKARNFAYYERLTVRDSSLSACTQAVIAAEVGHLDLAVRYAAEAALIDLDDLEHNARDGLHIAALSGAWLALVAGFGGLRDDGPELAFRPQLPATWQRLHFTVRWRTSQISVEIRPGEVTYSVEGDPVAIRHRSAASGGAHVEDRHELEPGDSVTLPWRAVVPITPEPQQPAGRSPAGVLRD